MKYLADIVAYTILLENGFFGNAEYRAYVDKAAKAEGIDAGALAGIALAGSGGSECLAVYIGEMPGGVVVGQAHVNAAIFRTLYGQFRSGVLSLQDLAGELYRIGSMLEGLTDKEEMFLLTFDDIAKYDPDKEQVRKRLDEFMDSYIESNDRRSRF